MVVGEVNGCLDILIFLVLFLFEVDYIISVLDIEICEGEDVVLMVIIILDIILIDSIVWNDVQGEIVGQGLEFVFSGLFVGSYIYMAMVFSLVGFV